MNSLYLLSLGRRVSFLIFTSILVIGCDQKRGSSYPSDSDQEAIAFFHSHKPDFDQMRALIESIPFMTLNGDRGTSMPKDAFNRSPQIKSELLKLMATLHLRWVNGTDSGWGIRLVFLADGMAMGGATKSFYYSKKPPKDIVPSIEGFLPSSPESASVYMPIVSDWYLQYEWGG